LEDFILDSGIGYYHENKPDCKKKRSKRYDARTSLNLKMFRLDSEL
jgi:hypothetical protein